MDERFTPRPVARWYWLGAAASLLFTGAICALYLVHLTTDPNTLPVDARALYLAEPAWIGSAFGLTGATGAIGAVLLLMRKRAAEALLLLSLLAAIVWFAGWLAVPQLRDLLTTTEIAIGIAVTLISWTVFSFAHHSRQRGWLR